ncbi:MAG: cellulase family glycosylhydrolase [Ferruginibacter sp.]
MPVKKYLAVFSVCCLLFQNLQAQSSFVRVKGQQFTLNGKPYYYIGTNYWYGALLGTIGDTMRGKERLLKELDFLHSKGVNNLRVLAGVEGTGKVNGVSRVAPSLQPEQGFFDTALLKGLDLLLYEMGKRKMKAVIYLSNNWEWSGGFLQYLNWNGLLPDSIMQRKLSWDENRDIVSKFYSCKPCTGAYYEQLKLVINRTNSITHKKYMNDPAIMAWELANEPRPMRVQAVPQWKQWMEEVAAYIKSIDKNHLVTTGNEGAMGSEDLETFESGHTAKAIDYLTIHIWPKNWGWFSDTSVQKSFTKVINNTNDYISKHAAVAGRLHKPLVIEEFGLPRDQQAFDPGTTTILRDKYYYAVFSAWDKSRKAGKNIGGCNFWGFAGTGRANPAGHYWWKDGDDYMTDPPPEEQGLNSVFDTDKSTWNIISSFSRKR